MENNNNNNIIYSANMRCSLFQCRNEGNGKAQRRRRSESKKELLFRLKSCDSSTFCDCIFHIAIAVRTTQNHRETAKHKQNVNAVSQRSFEIFSREWGQRCFMDIGTRTMSFFHNAIIPSPLCWNVVSLATLYTSLCTFISLHFVCAS